MKNQEQQILDRIEIIISNVITEAQELKKMFDVAGNEKFQTKAGKFSLSQIINPKKLDIKAFIALITLMGHKEKVFGNLPQDVIQVVCVDMYGEELNQELKLIFG
jgi:hypothetical protein